MDLNEIMVIPDLASLAGEIQPGSIVSRTFYKDEQMRAMVFGFAAGEELSEHTSSYAAVIQVIKGQAVVMLGEERHELATGAWVHMPPRLKHSVFAQTELIILLLMVGMEK